MHLHLFGQKVFIHDIVFFVLGVTVKINNFQAVAQGGRNISQRVSRGNKHYLGNIKRHIQKVVGKFFVLFRVQQFQKCRRRVAAPVAAHFINFVQQKYRVHTLGLADTLNNAPRHRTDIRSAVAADFAFVPHSSQRHPHKFAADGACNRFSQRGFPHAWRTCKAEHRPAQRII